MATRHRRKYREPGWEKYPVFWSYSVAFKRPRGRKLLWINTEEQSEVKASEAALEYMVGEYIEYGITKAYYKFFGGYSRQITSEEYEGSEHKVSPVGKFS